VLEAGSATGLSNLASVAIGPATTFSTSGVPAGSYFVRVRAVNAAGSSAVSNEVIVVVP
jgi:predicted phage tail protein